MADYLSKFLSNYFSVTDTGKFETLIQSCQAESVIETFQHTEPDGSIKYGFGSTGTIHGIPPEGEECGELYAFYGELQKLIPPDDAVIVIEIGNEKLNYFTACCTVITQAEIKSGDLDTLALELARKMLNNPEFETQIDY